MAPDRAEKLLLRAVAVLGWRSLPEDPASVKELVEGPLKKMIAEDIGVDAAALMLDDLSPILELAASGVRRKVSGSRVRAQPSVVPAPAEARDQKLQIAVATLGSLEDLRRHIGPSADVMRVRDAFELHWLIESWHGPLLVVIDGHRCAVELSSIAMLVPQIPVGCQVALWGFEQQDLARFLAMDRWSMLDAGDAWLDLAGALRAQARVAGQGRATG